MQLAVPCVVHTPVVVVVQAILEAHCAQRCDAKHHALGALGVANEFELKVVYVAGRCVLKSRVTDRTAVGAASVPRGNAYCCAVL